MPKIPSSEKLHLEGRAGSIEALLEGPQDQAPQAVAVVCHPHPVHGGTMQNKVVHTLARAFVSNNMAALRFNFRGVGQSAGNFDEGQGELADAMSALDWARARFAELPYWLAGFSFGGAIAIRAAAQTDPAGLVSVAPAVQRFAPDLEPAPTCPWLIVQGDQDELVDIEETIDFVNDLEPGPQLSVFAGGEHFFHGRLVELRNTVEEFVKKTAIRPHG